MLGDVVINDSLTIPEAELDESFVRSGGPGGQHVNKTATKVELRWKPADSAVLSEAQRARVIARLGGRLSGDGELVLTASGYRSQLRNREEARAQLAALVRGALARRKRRVRTRPGRRAVERRLEKKRQRGQRKKERRWKP